MRIFFFFKESLKIDWTQTESPPINSALVFDSGKCGKYSQAEAYSSSLTISVLVQIWNLSTYIIL